MMRLSRVHAEIGGQERAELGVPHRRALEGVGERRRRIELERHRVSVDLHGRGFVGRIELEPAPEAAVRDAVHGVVEAHEDRHRDLDPRRDTLPGGVGGGPGPVRCDVGGQRRADARLPIAVAHAPHLELADGDEARQAIAGPEEVVGIAVELELSPGQRQRAIGEDHLAGAQHGCPRSLLGETTALDRSRGAEPVADTEIVDVGGEARARIERGPDRAPCGPS